MNYLRIYNELMQRARTRVKVEGYKEVHHATPRCMKGTNDPSNLVVLTGREHLLAHILLTKIYPKRRRLQTPVIMMSNRVGVTLTTRQYEAVRHAVSERNREFSTGRKLSPESCKKIGDFHRGRKQSQTQIQNRVASFTGFKHSEETKRKLSEISTNMPEAHRRKIAESVSRLVQSEETKAKRSKSCTGRKHTEEAKAKMRGPRNESPETKARRSSAKKGFMHSEATRAVMSEKGKQNWVRKRQKQEMLLLWSAL